MDCDSSVADSIRNPNLLYGITKCLKAGFATLARTPQTGSEDICSAIKLRPLGRWRLHGVEWIRLESLRKTSERRRMRLQCISASTCRRLRVG
jgi:hypothetical protein